jgi:hypothetical protein
VAELERRVKELEAERRSAQHSEKSLEMKAALARNEELAAKNRALSLENQELAQSRAFEQHRSAGAACELPDDADPRAQLRYWAKQMRDGEGALRLSPEQNAALNVLLRRERHLDPNNPWREQ